MQQDRGLGRAFYIPALDGWRAIAVGLVMGAHCVPALINSGWKVGKYAAAGFERGGVGVDIFFCLSGYLISTILLREKERTKTIDFASFYIRRVFRIVPPVLLYLGVIFALRTLHFLPPSKTNDIIASLLFYRNYSSGGDWYTGHFWSLAIEEQFYLVAPLFLLLLPVRKAIVASLTLILICVATRYLEYREDLVYRHATAQDRKSIRRVAMGRNAGAFNVSSGNDRPIAKVSIRSSGDFCSSRLDSYRSLCTISGDTPNRRCLLDALAHRL
jgi:peptidoglycan/LPS O-acetylase OafA/YrhL